jgi:transcriptional regulator with XRE-family HTH domain
MKQTSFFRDQFGLTQVAMAIYLGVSKSQLSMYELGQRDLPLGSQTKLAEMTLFFDPTNNAAVLNSVVTQQELQLKEWLPFQLKELEYKLMKAQRRLEHIQKKHHQNLKLYSFALHLQKKEQQLADLLMQQALSGLEQNGLLSQTQQQLKIEGIKTQLDAIRILKEK